MERAQQRHAARRGDLDEVPELGPRPHRQLGACDLVGERTEADDDIDAFERLHLTLEERAAGLALAWLRLVPRWRALDSRGDPGVAELQAVVAPHRGRLVGEARAVHRPVEPVTAAVAGEDTPGAVPAVSRRRQAEHDDPRGAVAEARNRPPPIGLVAKRRPLLAGNLLPP